MKYIANAIFLLLLSACVTINSPSIPTGKAEQDPHNSEAWRAERPASDTPAETLIPKFQVTTLDNGLTLYVVEDHDLPIVQVALATKSGAGLDPKYKAGTASLAYSMVLEGAGAYDSLDFSAALAKLGTRISVLQVSTVSGGFGMGITRPKLNEGLGLLATAIKTPHFYAKDFVRIRKQTLQSLEAARANPNFLAKKAFFQAAFEGSSGYAHLASGTPQSVSQITLDDAKDYFKQHIHPENSALILAGDVTFEEAKKLARKYLANWRGMHNPSMRDGKAPLPFGPKNRSNTEIKLINRAHSPQSMIIIGQPVLVTDRDERFSALVMNEILGGMFSSRLNLKLREEKGWTYGARSSVNFNQERGIFSASSAIQVPYGADAIGEIFKTFEDMRDHRVSEEELAAAKDGMIRSYGGTFESVGSLASAASSLFLQDLPQDYFKRWTKEIRKVSRRDVKKAAEKMLDPAKQIVIAVGDLSALENRLRAMNLGTVDVL